MQDELAALNGAEPLGNTYNDMSNTSNLVNGGGGATSTQPARRQIESNPPPVLEDATRRRRPDSLGNNSITSKPAPTSQRQQRRNSLGYAAPTETSARRLSVGSDVSMGSSASARHVSSRKPISRTTRTTTSSSKDKSTLSSAQLNAHTAKTGTSNMLENSSGKTAKKPASDSNGDKPKARKRGWDDDDLESIASSIQSSVRRRRVAPRPLPVNRAPEPVITPGAAAPNKNASSNGATTSSPTTKIPTAPSGPLKSTVATTTTTTTTTNSNNNKAAAMVTPKRPSASGDPGTITTITISDTDSETDQQTGTVSLSPMTSGNRSAKQPHPFVQEMDEQNEPVARTNQPTSFQSPKPAAANTGADGRRGASEKPRASSVATEEVALSPMDNGRKASVGKSVSPTPMKVSNLKAEPRRDSNASDGVEFRVEDSDSDSDGGDPALNQSGRTPIHVLRERAKGEQAMNAMREDGGQQAPVVPPLPLFELSERRDREAAGKSAPQKPASAGHHHKNNDDDATPSLSGDSVSVSTITGTPTPCVAERKATPKVAATAAGKPNSSTTAAPAADNNTRAKPNDAAKPSEPAKPSEAAKAAAEPAKVKEANSPREAAAKPNRSTTPVLTKDKEGAKCCAVM